MHAPAGAVPSGKYVQSGLKKSRVWSVHFEVRLFSLKRACSYLPTWDPVQYISCAKNRLQGRYLPAPSSLRSAACLHYHRVHVSSLGKNAAGIGVAITEGRARSVAAENKGQQTPRCTNP